MHLPSIYFFFNDTATTEIYTLSLHDALPISPPALSRTSDRCSAPSTGPRTRRSAPRSEEHTSELQSRFDFVCRLLLDKKKRFRSLPPAKTSYTFQHTASWRCCGRKR